MGFQYIFLKITEILIMKGNILITFVCKNGFREHNYL